MQTYDTCRAGEIHDVRLGRSLVPGRANADLKRTPASPGDAYRAGNEGRGRNNDQTNDFDARRKALDETDTSHFNDEQRTKHESDKRDLNMQRDRDNQGRSDNYGDRGNQDRSYGASK